VLKNVSTSKNLVSNIGFVPEALQHTTDTKSRYANMLVEPMDFPLKHPPFIVRHAKADDFTQKTAFEQSLVTRFKSKINKSLNK
jgi:hypothetical protein